MLQILKSDVTIRLKHISFKNQGILYHLFSNYISKIYAFKINLNLKAGDYKSRLKKDVSGMISC